MHHRTFSSIFGLYPQDASSTLPTFPSCDKKGHRYLRAKQVLSAPSELNTDWEHRELRLEKGR